MDLKERYLTLLKSIREILKNENQMHISSIKKKMDTILDECLQLEKDISKEKEWEVGGSGLTEEDKQEINNSLLELKSKIEENSSQIDEKAKQSDLEIQKARIDTFTKLEEGSTTADAELKDIRVGVDGATYENAGEAVRGQVKNVSKLLLDETIFEGKEINLTTPISCTIKTDTEATVYSHGKNYLPFNIAMNDFENKSYYVEHGEDYVIGKALVGETFKNFYLSSIYLPTGTYVFSRKVEIIHGSATGNYGFIYVKNLDTNSFISSFRITEESKKIVLSEGANIRIDMYINMNGIVNEDLTIKFSNLQIEKGEETTNYEKYIGEIKTGTFFNFSCFENMSITSNTNMKAIVKKSKDFAKQSDLALLKKDIEDIKNTQNTVDEIVCWGDSLTASAGSTTGKPDTEANTDVSYPAVLERLTGITTINAGVGGETSWMVAARQGGMPLEVLPTTIPATKTAIRIYLKGQEQDYFYNPETSKWEFLKNNLSYNIGVDGNARINPCKIDGIEGTLSRIKLSSGEPDPETGETVQSDKYAYYFTRNEEGEENTFSTCRNLITYGSEKYKNAINIIWAGQNDAPLHEGKYIMQIGVENRIKNMIKHLENKEKYIIMDLPSGTNESRASATISFTQTFGENYLNIRNYICTYGLEVANSLGANITLSEQDNTDIANGKIPSCFRIDGVHGNYWYYQIVARAVYEKGKDLGYW